MLLGLSACATVDVADISPTNRTAQINLMKDKNVVIQSSETVHNKAIEMGLAQSSEVRLQMAANRLLKGRNADLDETNPYLSLDKTLSAIRSDIALVNGLTKKTAQSAKLHIDVVPVDADLRSELKALEKALGVLEQTQQTFALALGEYADASLGLKDLKSEITKIKTIANVYGDRVRADVAKANSPAS